MLQNNQVTQNHYHRVGQAMVKNRSLCGECLTKCVKHHIRIRASTKLFIPRAGGSSIVSGSDPDILSRLLLLTLLAAMRRAGEQKWACRTIT